MKNVKTSKVTFIVKDFPKKTESIYLSGNCEALGNWLPENAIKMQYFQKEDGEEIFFAEVDLIVGDDVEYKYLNHRDWRSVECGLIAQEIPNRQITIKKDQSDRRLIDEIRGFRIY